MIRDCHVWVFQTIHLPAMYVYINIYVCVYMYMYVLYIYIYTLRYHPGTNFGFTSPFTTTHEMILGQDGKELGWSVAATFPVAQMESANVVYAGIPSSAPRR